jgi:FkbM family methyltransferase
MLVTEDTSQKHRLDSWAQEGEDLVLRRFFEGQKRGFYVDIGAHHPHRFSNTFFFYKRGWRGINIDAMPGSMGIFNEQRPEDINLELAISDQPRMTYFMFNDPALNGLCAEVAERRDGKRGNYIVKRLPVRTSTLAQIFDQHVTAGTTIDFLTIDVEGHDLGVLKSNDWSMHRPRMILAEDLEKLPLDELGNSKLVQYLRGVGYCPCARTFNTLFFETR